MSGRFKSWRTLSLVMIILGGVLGLAFAVALWESDRFGVGRMSFRVGYLYGAIGWLLGVGAIVYAVFLLFYWKDGVVTSRWRIHRLVNRPAIMTVALVLGFLLVAQASFSAAGIYAFDKAKERAVDIEASCVDRPLLTMVSTVPLNLTGSGVVHDFVVQDGQTVHTYSGLRLLLHDNHRFVVWPAAQSPRAGAIIVPETDSMVIRFEPQPLTRAQRDELECPTR